MLANPSKQGNENKARGRWRIAGGTIGLILLTCITWYAVPLRPRAAHVAGLGEGLDTAGLGCGPAALLAVAAAHDAHAAAQLRAVLDDDGLATRPVSSLYDLACWARRAGLEPLGLKVDAHHLSRLPLPAIVHVKPDHFLAVIAVDDERAVVVDQGPATRDIPRREFDRRFSGYVLCFKPFLEGRG